MKNVRGFIKKNIVPWQVRPIISSLKQQLKTLILTESGLVFGLVFVILNNNKLGVF